MGRFHRHDDGTVHHHGNHSGYSTGSARIEVLESIFAENDTRAAINRHAFEVSARTRAGMSAWFDWLRRFAAHLPVDIVHPGE